MRYLKDCTKQDYVLRISQALPAELNIINYELFLLAVDNAVEDASLTDINGFLENLRKAREFLLELQMALDPKYEISSQLMSIYVFVNKILTNSMRTKSCAELEDAKKIMSELMNTWKQALPDVSSADFAKITAGFMYNRSGVIEEISSSNKDYKI